MVQGRVLTYKLCPSSAPMPIAMDVRAKETKRMLGTVLLHCNAPFIHLFRGRGPLPTVPGLGPRKGRRANAGLQEYTPCRGKRPGIASAKPQISRPHRVPDRWIHYQELRVVRRSGHTMKPGFRSGRRNLRPSRCGNAGSVG